jgi:putative CocE/NonD family hydrolase
MGRSIFIVFLLISSFAVYSQKKEVGGYTYIETMVQGGAGNSLVTRIYLPQGEGPWPVVITRTPYFMEGQTSGDNLKQGQEYAMRGLGFIQQYCRGKGGSEGVYEPNIYEREDGLALVNWVAKQNWCRSIGLFGASYTALTAWIIADSLPDKVKGIYLHHYGVDRHLSAYKDGLFRQDILTGWAIDNATELTVRPPRDREQPYYEEARYMPQKEMDVALLGVELPWYRDWITHTDYNDPYWQSGVWAQLRSIPPQIKVPVTIVAGLFDHHIEGTLKGYELLPPKTKKNSRLIVGAWNHFYQITPEVHHPQHAGDINVFTDQFDWLYSVVALDRVPKGEVKTYFIGADRWETFDSWPVRYQGTITYYFANQVNEDNPEALDMAMNANRSP